MPEDLEQVESAEIAEEVVDTGGEETAAEEPTEVAGDYSPDWLDESPAQPQQQGPSPEEVAAYQRAQAGQQQQQYQQPPYPQQPPAPTETDLDRLVRDTRGTISDIAAQQAQHVAANVMNQQFSPYAQQMQQFIEAQTQSKVAVSDRAVRGMYDSVFNKDEVFVGNEAVRNKVTETLRNLRSQAVMAARNGNHAALDMFNDPAFADITLYAAKRALGVTHGANAPVSSPHIEGAAPAAQSKKSYTDELDPDTIEGLKRTYGSNWESRYEKARIEEDKYQDFS